MADVAAATIFDVVADRIAAARISDQRDTRGAALLLQLPDRLGELAALILGRGAVGLLDLVVRARQGIGEIDRGHALARHAVGFHPPERRQPERRVIAIAMHEQDRRDVAGGRRLGQGRPNQGRLSQARDGKTAGQQGQRAGPLQNCSPRQRHWSPSPEPSSGLPVL
ncbi:hypothetical protein ACVWW1_006606 [Bradyrhizobium sp. JR3.5]